MTGRSDARDNEPKLAEALEVARLFRLLNEGTGYDDLIDLVERGSEVGWTPARERIVQDGLRLRLTQLFHRKVEFDQIQRFIDVLSQCDASLRFGNPRLAERLNGYRLVAEQMAQRPGDVPSQSLLRDPSVSRVLTHLAAAPVAERTLEVLDQKFGREAGIDAVLWPLLNLGYIEKVTQGDVEVYQLTEELAAHYEVAREDPTGLVLRSPDLIRLVVPIQPIFDFLTPAYAGTLREVSRYRIEIKTQRGVRNNRNWFSIDESSFPYRRYTPGAELKAAVLPLSNMVEESLKNSIDLLPTNVFVGFHWLIAREAVPGSAARIFSYDGKLVPVFRTVIDLQNFFHGRRVIVLLDEPMEPHARFVLDQLFKIEGTCFRTEDNVRRLEEPLSVSGDLPVLSITTGPMLAMADPEKHALLFEFNDVVREVKARGLSYEVFARTIFNCSLNIHISREDWSTDGIARDASYRVHKMMTEVMALVRAEPKKFAEFIANLWAHEASEGPDPVSYSGDLTPEGVLRAIRASYRWIGDPAVLVIDPPTCWSDTNADLFWSNDGGHFFPSIMQQCEQDSRAATDRLAALLSQWEKKNFSSGRRSDVKRKIQAWIAQGAPNHAIEQIELLSRDQPPVS